MDAATEQYFIQMEVNLCHVPLANSKSHKRTFEGPDGSDLYYPTGKSNFFSIILLNLKMLLQYTFADDPVMFSASFTYSGNLLVGTQENILICRLEKDSVVVKDTIEGFNNYADNLYSSDRRQNKIHYWY